MKPFISVIMPAKNRADEIRKAIGSVINQSFTNWELVIIDDHSIDKTAEVIKKNQDKKIKYYYLKNGTGPGVARDYGIKKAEGKIILIADSDDTSKPDRFKLTYYFLKNHPEIDVVYGDIETIDGYKKILRSCPFDKELLKKYNFIFNSTTSFKKELYLKTSGYDRNFTNSEDYDLWLTFMEKGAKFGYIDHVLTNYRIHPGGLTQSVDYSTRKSNLARVRKKHHLLIPDIESTKKITPSHIWKRIEQKRGLDFWFNFNVQK